MFLIDWPSVATDAFLAELRGIAGAGNDPDDATLRASIAATLAHAGGLPIADAEWTEDQCTSCARRLVSEAIGHALGTGDTPALPGCDLGPGAAGLDRTIELRDRVAVNYAPLKELEPLPVLGPTTAPRTIAARQEGGSFDSASEIAARVSGVDDSGAARLALMLDFAERPRPQALPVDFDSRVSAWLEQFPAATEAESLVYAMEALATITAGDPHPLTLARRRRTELPDGGPAIPDLTDVASVEVLEDRQYYARALDLLSAANTRIDVAMFFISLTSEEHPSKDLLEKVAEKHNDGVAVRVLVDRDSEDDPYGSRVINQPAIDFLKAAGVPVRIDSEDNLLHSKFFIVDDDLSVIGSHNWTAGSFFRYRDMSLGLRGSDFASVLADRFDALWGDAVDP